MTCQVIRNLLIFTLISLILGGFTSFAQNSFLKIDRTEIYKMLESQKKQLLDNITKLQFSIEETKNEGKPAESLRLKSEELLRAVEEQYRLIFKLAEELPLLSEDEARRRLIEAQNNFTNIKDVKIANVLAIIGGFNLPLLGYKKEKLRIATVNLLAQQKQIFLEISKLQSFTQTSPPFTLTVEPDRGMRAYLEKALVDPSLKYYQEKFPKTVAELHSTKAESKKYTEETKSVLYKLIKEEERLINYLKTIRDILNERSFMDKVLGRREPVLGKLNNELLNIQLLEESIKGLKAQAELLLEQEKILRASRPIDYRRIEEGLRVFPPYLKAYFKALMRRRAGIDSTP